MNKYDLLNRSVLASCYLWIQNHLDERAGGEIPEICYKIKTAGFNSLHINRFSKEEADLLKEITHSEEFRPIKETEISLIVMPLEVMKLWIENVPKENRPIINISDKKLLRGKNEYLMYMLSVKHKKPEMYQKQKDIIDRTAANASAWFDHMREKCYNDRLTKGD